jgi:glycosyltransferase involved in cell wall biosynthesis
LTALPADTRSGPVDDDLGAARDGSFTFTVFTPTFNRGHVLHRAFESLRAQTFRDFEWLVVDNASTDATSQLIDEWRREATFEIRYIRNETNIGRQGSWLKAISEARGELFTELRSADGLVPHALERLKHHWDSIPDSERSRYSAVSALAMDEHAVVVGTKFPADVFDSDSSEIRYRYRVRGDKWGFQRTDVLRRQQIPRIEGYAGSIPESIVWRAIGRRYRTRYVNEPLRIYWQDQPPGLTRPVVGWVNAPGRVLEAEDRLSHDLRWFTVTPVTLYRDAVAYVCSGLHIGRSFAGQVRGLRHPLARLLWLAALVPGIAFYVVERYLPSIGRRLPSP